MCSRATVYFKLGLNELSLLGFTGYRRHETEGYSPALRSVTAPSHEPQPERTSTYRIDADFPAFFGGRKYSAQSEPDQVRQFYQEAARTVTKLRLPGQH